jgi:hypothetical protein
MTEIRAGDKFEIVVTVVDMPSPDKSGRYVRLAEQDNVVWATNATLLAGKRLPRQIKAGDVVVKKGGGRRWLGDVVHINNGWAWVRLRDAYGLPQRSELCPLSDLTPDSEG